MTDEPNKTDRQDAQAPADDQTRRQLAWMADQAAKRAVAAYIPATASRGYDQSDEQVELMKALVKAQANFDVPKKTKTAEVKKGGQLLYTYNYADLGAIMAACLPALNKADLALIQPIEQDGEDLFLVTKLVHAETGQWMSTRLPLGYAKADAQIVGSSLTYMRRYGLSALLGIATEDDDDGSREAAISGQNRRTQPTQGEGSGLPGRYEYAYDDEIIWQVQPRLETKRISSMSLDELQQAERRIIKRGQHFKQAGEAAKVADARRDLELVRAALKALNTEFDERSSDAGQADDVLPPEEEDDVEDGVHDVSEPGGIPGGDPSGEGRPAEEVAGMGSAPDEDQPPAPAEGEGADQERTVGDDGNDGADDSGHPDDQGGMVGGQDQGERTPDQEGTPSDDDVPSASDEPGGPAGPEGQEPSGGQPGRDPGTDDSPEGRRDRPKDDPRRDTTTPDETASLSLNDRYKVNALSAVKGFDLTYLRELNDGEITGSMMAEPALFRDAADDLKSFREAMPEADRPEPLSSDWIVDVWLPYWETNKAGRKDARKLAKIWIAHHDLKNRYAQRRTERMTPEEQAKEQDALSALKQTFDGKSVS